MKYVEFKKLIHDELVRNPAGLTWGELKSRLDLPYDRPCPTWVKQMEDEIGLSRARKTQRAYTWKIVQNREKS